MPEGDTIHKLARYMAPRLTDQLLVAAHVPSLPELELPGLRVRAVEARGKHLFFAFDEGGELRCHLGLYGSWHRYRPGWRPDSPRRRPAWLATERDVFVGFSCAEFEWLPWGATAFLRRSNLGPDLAVELPSASRLATRRRVLLAPRVPVADVLLDQRIAAGIGNVYKSELLFLEGLAPATPWEQVSPPSWTRLYASAHQLLSANVDRAGMRQTRSEIPAGPRLWVYGRAGRPCLSCGARLRSGLLGRHRRSTYWCPRCQAPDRTPDERFVGRA